MVTIKQDIGKTFDGEIVLQDDPRCDMVLFCAGQVISTEVAERYGLLDGALSGSVVVTNDGSTTAARNVEIIVPSTDGSNPNNALDGDATEEKSLTEAPERKDISPENPKTRNGSKGSLTINTK